MKKVVIVILLSIAITIQQSNGISIKDFIKSRSLVGLNRHKVKTIQGDFDFTTEDFPTSSTEGPTTQEPSTTDNPSSTETIPTTESSTQEPSSTDNPSSTETIPTTESSTQEPSSTDNPSSTETIPTTESSTQEPSSTDNPSTPDSTTDAGTTEDTTIPTSEPSTTPESDRSTTEDYGTTFPPTTTRKPIDRDVCPIGSENPVSFPHTDNKVSTSCGEHFDCKTGGIFYKPFETVVPNERCIWTLAVPNAKGYDITVQYYGYEPKQNNDDDHGLIISEFRRTQVPRHFIPTTVNTTTITNTAMVMITFFTGSEVTNKAGFILQFKTRFDGSLNPPVNANSKHVLVGSEQYYYQYGALATNQLGSTIFMPKDNIYRPGKENRAVYMLESLYSCTYEQLKIYFFNTTCVGPHKWEYQGRICGTSPAQELIKSPEPMVVIFESSSVPYSRAGFHFTYAASC